MYGDENWNNSKKRNETNIKKYGNICSLHGKEPAEKTQETWLKKYGVRNRLDSPNVQQQMRQIIFNTYNVMNPFQIPDVIQRIQSANKLHQHEITQKSMITRANKSDEEKENIKNQTKNTVRIKRFKQLLSNVNVKPLFTEHEYVSTVELSSVIFKWKCLRCGIEFEAPYMPFIINKLITDDLNNTVYGRCPHCFPHSKTDGISIEELSLYQYISSIYKKHIIQSKRILHGIDDNSKLRNLQIDIYLPDLNIGIEYNGIYFHSLHYVQSGYHLLKTKLAERQGIKLIHIRSDQWLFNRKKIESFLYDIICNNINIDNFLNNDIEYVDRSLFNKCFISNKYILIGETQPNIINIPFGNKQYSYEDSGYLIYKKIK